MTLGGENFARQPESIRMKLCDRGTGIRGVPLREAGDHLSQNGARNGSIYFI